MKTRIPVFTYHDAVNNTLVWDLSFLARNKYRTLDANELHSLSLDGRISAAEKCVVLTFDDARLSCWTVLTPLLNEYQEKVILFVAPNLLTELPGSSRNTSSQEHCSWEQIAAMSTSGLIDIQNHSMEHELIFSGSEIVDFQHPYGVGHYPFYKSFRDGLLDADSWGTPIFTYAWRGAREEEFIPSPELTSHCVDFVAENGGRDFFMNRNWRNLLNAHISGFCGKRGEMRRIPFERESYIRNSIRSSQKVILEKTGCTPRFFAPPAHSYDALVVKILKEEGFLGLFNGGSPSTADKDGFVIFGRERKGAPRRLPGKGRETLLMRAMKKVQDVLSR